jgi:methylase of polypeptide subunit release factors
MISGVIKRSKSMQRRASSSLTLPSVLNLQNKKVEFGDFQTPLATAIEVCRVVGQDGFAPKAIIEPTCGFGTFLQAATASFPAASRIIGFEVNPDYAAHARRTMGPQARIEVQDFFQHDWRTYLARLPKPILIVGNPPWVTNSGLGQIEGANLPTKTNLGVRLKGLDALTGKSNFDISEWMICRLLEALQGPGGRFAMLCKTAVARKVIRYAKAQHLCVTGARCYSLDSKSVFGVSVDTCLFAFDVTTEKNYSFSVYRRLSDKRPERFSGFVGDQFVSDLDLYEKFGRFDGTFPFKWRSGIKHDCSPVLELTRQGQAWVNGLDEEVSVEEDFLFPLLKSSDLNASRILSSNRAVLVTQRKVGEDTAPIQGRAKRLWKYLESRRARLDARKSSIYRGKPPFSMFGVGDYSFAKWKVAISGLYKNLNFVIVGPIDGKPTMLDDTCNLVACRDEEHAVAIHALLHSEEAQGFLNSIVSWDSKRPLTTEVLHRIDLHKLSEIALGGKYSRLFSERPEPIQQGLRLNGKFF